MSPGGTKPRLLVGLLFAPLIVVPVTFVGYGLLHILHIDGFRGNVRALWSAAGNFAAASLVVAYVVQAVFGAPISLFLFRRGYFTFGRFLALGAVCGAIPFVVADLVTLRIHNGGGDHKSSLLFAGMGSVFGAAIGVATYVIAGGKRTG